MSINIPLSVTDYAGIQRVDEPLTSGVPLPESANVFLIKHLEVCDANSIRVPTQFTILSRWKGTPEDKTKPIKWVLLDFNANVDIDSTSTYYLRDGAEDYTSDTILTISDEDNRIIVETGAADFTISKNHFNIFDYVDIENNVVLSQPNEGGIVLTDAHGKRFTTLLEPPEEIIIEEQGPLRAVIKIRGVFKAEDGSYFAPSVHFPDEKPKFDQPYISSFFYYNCRIHFYNDKNYVKVFLTIENNGANGRTNPEPLYAPIQVVYFDSINLMMKRSGLSNIVSEDSSTFLEGTYEFTLYQDWKEREEPVSNTLVSKFAEGIQYECKKNDVILSNGTTNPGWMHVDDIGISIRHFWQNFPNKLSVDDTGIKIGLWPGEGYGPYTATGKESGMYLFDSGRHKTHEMMLSFGTTPLDIQTISKSAEYPLMAVAPPGWYAQTGALGIITPGGLGSSDPEIDEAMKRYDRFQTGMVCSEDSDNGLTISNIKTRDNPVGEYPDQSHFFGWMDFGDLLWYSGSAHSSLHYDWTWKMLLHYLRTGERKLFDAGIEMAKHRYDIDQYHGERTSTEGHHLWTNQLQFNELDGHDQGGRIGKPTHNWNSGIILYYLLTGDRKALEAAEENTQGILNYFGPGGLFNAATPRCTGEIRAEGWSMLNLIDIYRVTGNSLYLEVAKNIAKNRVLFTEQDCGGRGFVGIGPNGSTARTAMEAIPCECVDPSPECNRCHNMASGSLAMCYINEGLIAVHKETQDDEIGALLIRMADFIKNEMLFGGVYNSEGKYYSLRVVEMWIEEDPDGSIRRLNDPRGPHGGNTNPLFDLYWSDYLAYAYQLTGNLEYLNLARQCFRDMMFYYIGSTSQGYVDPESRDTVTFIDNMWIQTHTKIHGWLGRTNQVYLNTEWQLQQEDSIPIIENVNVVNSNWPDSSDMTTFALDAVRLTNAVTDEEKALAIFRFITMFTSRTDNNAPQERALGSSYIDDPLKTLNIYGAHWCDGLVRVMEVACRSIGLGADKLVRGGHTMADIGWVDIDGINRRHWFDVSELRYTYDRSATHIASADELGSDDSLFIRPVRGPVLPIVYGLNMWHLSPQYGAYRDTPPPHNMDLNLRLGEKLTKFSYEASPAYLNNYGYENANDFKHGPYTIDAGSGILEYDPDVSVLNETGVEIFEIKSPYIISDAFLSGSFNISDESDKINVSISTDNGTTWKDIWTANSIGDIALNFSFADKFDVYTNPPADLISPFGRYDYLLKVERSGDAVINYLKIRTHIQHNIFSMPILWPGNNLITINVGNINGAALKITYEWDDLLGTARQNVVITEEPRYSYEIITSGDEWEDVILKSITVEVIPKDGLGNRVLIKEQEPAIIINIGPADAFLIEQIVGTSYPEPIKTLQEYLSDLDSSDTQVQIQAISGLIQLDDAAALPTIENIAINSIDAYVKNIAVQALYHIGKDDTIEILRTFLHKDSIIKWKYDENNPAVEREHWYSISSTIGHLLTEEKYSIIVPDLIAILEDMNATSTDWRGPGLSIVRSIGRIGDSRAIPIIQTGFSEHPDTVCWVIWSLGELGDISSISTIQNIFERSSVPDCYDKHSNNDCYELYPIYAAEALAKLDRIPVDGDINIDGIIDIEDYKLVCNALGKHAGEVGYNEKADYDNNSNVTYSDFQKWYEYYKLR